jgi:hypothetical protein
MTLERRFSGHIAGVGSTSGTRVVLGHWQETPMGPFSDVMVETRAGHRVLLAPNGEVAAFIAGTYTFDELRVEPVSVDVAGREWRVESPSLTLGLLAGGPTPLGRLLGVVPRRLAARPTWCTVTDPLARLMLRGVRTRGTARAGRREFYGVTGAWSLVSASGAFDGHDLGHLAPVDPPCRFGFSSTPRRPTLATVVTTVVGH